MIHVESALSASEVCRTKTAGRRVAWTSCHTVPHTSPWPIHVSDQITTEDLHDAGMPLQTKQKDPHTPHLENLLTSHLSEQSSALARAVLFWNCLFLALAFSILEFSQCTHPDTKLSPPTEILCVKFVLHRCFDRSQAQACPSERREAASSSQVLTLDRICPA